MRAIFIVMLLLLSSCGFTPTLAKNSYDYKALSELRIASVTAPDRARAQRIIAEVFFNDPHTLPRYDVRIDITYNNFPMGIMTDSQITRYRITAKLHYTLIDAEAKKTIDVGSMSLNSSYDSEGSDFANFIAERSVSDQTLKELAEELKVKLMLVISSREKNGKDSR